MMNRSLISEEGWEKPGRQKGRERLLPGGGLVDGIWKTVVEVLRASREATGETQGKESVRLWLVWLRGLRAGFRPDRSLI